jgi:hypothetical protein
MSYTGASFLASIFRCVPHVLTQRLAADAYGPAHASRPDIAGAHQPPQSGAPKTAHGLRLGVRKPFAL